MIASTTLDKYGDLWGWASGLLISRFSCMGFNGIRRLWVPHPGIRAPMRQRV